jgi:uncharacterized protein (DUF952 family)
VVSVSGGNPRPGPPAPRSGDVEPLLHLIGRDEWAAAQARGTAYRPPAAEQVGFVHLSSPAQVLIPAERFHAGRDDLVVLVVHPGRLRDPVRWEPGVPPEGDLLFPHLYGSIDHDAVVAVVPLTRDAGGRYEAPTLPRLSSS